MSILVAEDVEEIRTLVAQWLRAKGHRVECASTGRGAIEFVRTQEFDLVIADVLMPDGDGIELINEIKHRRSATRVLVMSGGGRSMTASECIRMAVGMGAHGAVLKPFNEPELAAGIRAAMSDRPR